MKKIAMLVGSLRKESFSRKAAESLIALAPESLKLAIVEIAELQMYNQDLDENPPVTWTSFRDKIREYDGFIFVTPEYNRSVPAVLKNALDVGSRPYGKSVWNGKPGAVVSVSPGPIGGFGANHHLRQTLAYLNVPAMAQPEAYVGGAAALVDAEGMIADESRRSSLRKFLIEFEAWVGRNAD